MPPSRGVFGRAPPSRLRRPISSLAVPRCAPGPGDAYGGRSGRPRPHGCASLGFRHHGRFERVSTSLFWGWGVGMAHAAEWHRSAAPSDSAARERTRCLWTMFTHRHRELRYGGRWGGNHHVGVRGESEEGARELEGPARRGSESPSPRAAPGVRVPQIPPLPCHLFRLVSTHLHPILHCLRVGCHGGIPAWSCRGVHYDTPARAPGPRSLSD